MIVVKLEILHRARSRDASEMQKSLAGRKLLSLAGHLQTHDEILLLLLARCSRLARHFVASLESSAIPIKSNDRANCKAAELGGEPMGFEQAQLSKQHSSL